MFSLLLVDDEPIEREGLRLMINSHFQDIQIVGEAGNGFQAVQLYKEVLPDIVFIDINMPGMDGLSAAEEMIRLNNPSCFVIITSYSSFEYAQQAIRLGIDDFLLKPCDVAGIERVISSAADKLEGIRTTESIRESLSRQVSEFVPVIERDLVLALKGNSDTTIFRKLIELIGIKLSSAVVIEIIFKNKHSDIISRIKLKLSSLGYKCAAAYTADTITLIVINEKNDSIESDVITRYLYRYFSDLYTENIHLGCGISVNVPELLPESAKTARLCLEHALNENLPHCRKEDLHNIYNCNYGSEGLSTILDEISSPPSPEGKNYHPIVISALKYVLSNFTKPINLNEIAAYLKVSTFYLSKLIKKETGMNISDIITEIRVIEARKLLSDPLANIKEVTFNVGFNSQSYFSRVFKRYTGRTPTEFRKENFN